MKTSASPALLTFLVAPPQSGIVRADLITIALPNGQTLNVVFGTNTDIVYQGTKYYCSAYGAWERGAYENKADFKPDAGSWELKALIEESLNFPGTSTSLMQVVTSGVLSGSLVTVQTLFWPLGYAYNQQFYLAGGVDPAWTGGYTSGVGMGTMMLTIGQLGSVKKAGRSNIVSEIFDLTYILNRQVPPFSIQTACRHSLFDASCTLNVATFTSSAVSLDSSSTSLYLNLTIPARVNSTPYSVGNLVDIANVIYMCTTAGTTASSAPTFNNSRGAVTTDGTAKWTSMNGAYVLGYVKFTGGQNSGLAATVKAMALSATNLQQLQLIKPLIFPVAGGDALQLIPGCDKTIATCQNVYNNLINFAGQPFVPNPETAA